MATKKPTSPTGRKIGSLTLYSVDEVAAVLGIQPRTLRDYLADGRVEGRKIANRWYVSEDALRRYFHADERGGQGE